MNSVRLLFGIATKRIAQKMVTLTIVRGYTVIVYRYWTSSLTWPVTRRRGRGFSLTASRNVKVNNPQARASNQTTFERTLRHPTLEPACCNREVPQRMRVSFRRQGSALATAEVFPVIGLRSLRLRSCDRGQIQSRDLDHHPVLDITRLLP